MAEIGRHHVGITLGLAMSRLERSCKNWYQLAELCGIFGTPLANQDGAYDPIDYNDGLLVLCGMMSEAELHVIRSSLHDGSRAVAR